MRKLAATTLIAASVGLLFSASAGAHSFGQGAYGQRGLNSPSRPLYNPERYARPWAGIEARQQNQRARIVQGLRSGELTPHEANALRREQRAIEWEERRYLADGVLTPNERWRLQRDLDWASRNIERERHDGQRRY